MSSLILGNGSLLITLDSFGEVRDFYFPHVGLENHMGGHLRHRVGVYCNGGLSWISEDPRWEIRVECEENALASSIVAKNLGIEVELVFKDIVYNESSIFLRQVVVKNLASYNREIKLYFGQEFKIGQSHGGETAYFDPKTGSIIHYKGERAFLINGESCDGAISDYAVGHLNLEKKKGTYYDAEDGLLSKNPIEHGSIDSVVGFYNTYESSEEKIIRYWITAGKSIEDAVALNSYVLKKTPSHLIKSTESYWKAWVNKYTWSFHDMSSESVSLFKKSLMFVRAHVDDGGGIIASADGSVLQYGEDTYAYVWPRDAAYAAFSLDRAGDSNVAERFFNFCHSVIDPDGYFMHKYLPNQSLGSSWEPWVRDGIMQLPIQEDETAIVIWALAQHYKHSNDLEFIEKLYNPLVERAANFMVAYRDEHTGLPKPSYNLWEERHGVSTYTSATVYGALMAAASLAGVLGKEDRERFYRSAADDVRKGILEHLFDSETGNFINMIEMVGQNTIRNKTADISSVYGIFAFGVLEPDDARLIKAFDATVARLSVNGGIVRYEHDRYYSDGDISNPWFICTLWYADYLIALAKNEEDLKKVLKIFDWVVERSLDSGVLSEQVSAKDGKQRSFAPLMWSHASYVNSVLNYLDKLEKLGVCDACNPVP